MDVYCVVQERPVDIVVDGFVHLQQYHVREIARGLASVGSYRLCYDHPVCAAAAVPLSVEFVLAPDDIVSSLRDPPAEVNKPQQRPIEEDCQSDASHAQLLSSRVSLCGGVWIVDDNIRCHDKFMVKLSVQLILSLFWLICLVTFAASLK